jgi:hypothetical protein
MNKLYSQITSLIIVTALAISFAFGIVDLATVVSASTAILGIIYGLYKQYETDAIAASLESKELENLELKFEIENINSLKTPLTFTTTDSVLDKVKRTKKVQKPKQ